LSETDVTMDPLKVLAYYAVLSAVLFALYSWDKRTAQRRSWRIPESTLHLLSLLGGWPGALLGQQVFRHKTRKQPFRTVFWGTVGVNCVVLAWIVSRMAN
jgi:uncharacterized membrane protein YsdA (DUF1294 family)